MKHLFILLCLFALLKPTLSQELKVEQELKVLNEDVPENARIWLKKAFGEPKKVKWYYETNNTKETYEAKFKSKGDRFSVEFDKEGYIEDVEIRRSWSDIDKKTRQNLQRSLKAFRKFKLRKIQEQWSARKNQDLLSGIISKDLSAITVQYEIEFRAEINGVLSYWEGLFLASGELIQKRRIKTRPTDNFDF